MDGGDFVIVVNAAKIVVTSDRLLTKQYHSHSGHPGGYRAETLGDLNARKPTEAIRRAVKGMLPKTKLAAVQLKKLKIYAGAEHPHAPQQPKPLA
jgi:large subunit ribosomal protein L13